MNIIAILTALANAASVLLPEGHTLIGLIKSFLRAAQSGNQAEYDAAYAASVAAANAARPAGEDPIA